ncbi:MAG TPA: ABC-F family ATP-binding cassette domain-containing protein [Acidimicrobiales bacterium]|nr:ABC-F family ATP-binding cassette domain-containing protein [Acidimicrobiales bacterium]
MPSSPAAPAATLVARRLQHERGGRVVLDDVSLTVGPDTCLGVVGPNGVGKSTLLQVLAGLITPTAGDVRVDPPTATVGYLSQEHAHDGDETVRAALYRRTGAAAAEAALTGAAAALGDAHAEGGGDGATALAAEERYATALARYEALSAGDFEARLVTTLEQVGLPAEVADRPAARLSGGQEARVALAATLLARFDVTLLDEPTNDLDFDGLARLEEMVARRRGGLVIVSHDRAFLDRSVTDVLELDEHTRGGRLYGGGWSGYLAERAADRQHAAEAYAVYESQRSELRTRAQRERQWATSGVAREKKSPRDNDKAQRDFRINRTERLAARARRTERALDSLEVVEKPWEGWELRFSINEAKRSGDVVAHLADAVVERAGGGGEGCGSDAGGAFRLGPFTLDIAWADRIALVGPNGSGKTTLVDAILGRLPLVEGTRRLGPSVVVGELAQDRRVLADASASVSEAFVTATGLPRDRARSQLAKFGLGAEAVLRPPSSLSPGERTRAELAAFAAKGVNFLVLDEPTNHLDLPAIEQLEDALAGYEGTLLLVSHDRRLLESVTLSRRIALPAHDEPFRGLREDR